MNILKDNHYCQVIQCMELKVFHPFKSVHSFEISYTSGRNKGFSFLVLETLIITNNIQIDMTIFTTMHLFIFRYEIEFYIDEE